jgi:hypothetical protein
MLDTQNADAARQPHAHPPRGHQTNGFETTDGILEVSPDSGILMLTMLKDDHLMFTAVRAAAGPHE